ncbi:MAG: TonB-dependent receptor [Pseudomonadota bacterium]
MNTRPQVRVLAVLLVFMGNVNAASDDIEEVVVSATYRDTRLMDTPLTISAVTAEDIVAKGIEDIQTLYQSIPGMSYRTNSATYNTLSIRGLTPPAGGGGSVVGVYLDNMPITDGTNGGLRQTMGPLFDMERVEVLKGPQGTLYGEGNMGGALRYITKKPDPTGFSWAVKGSGESIGESSGLSFRGDVMVNIPVAERLALRLVAYKRDRKGVLDQVAPRNKKDVDTTEEEGVRALVTWFATDTLELSGMVNVIDSTYGGPGLGYHCFTESTPSDPAGQVPRYALPGTTCGGQYDQLERDPYVTHLAHPTHTSGGYDEQAMYNFNIEWQTSLGVVNSSTSYFDRTTNYSEETSPRFSAGLNALVDGGCFGALAACGPNVISGLGGDGSFAASTERFVQEIRLVSNNAESNWNYAAGIYYKSEDSQTGEHDGCTTGGGPAYADSSIGHCWLQYSFLDGVSVADQVAIINWLNAIVPGTTNFPSFGEQSIFGEIGYRFNDQWEVLAGLRYAEVNYDLDVGRPGTDSRANPVNSLSNETKSISPKVTVTWRPADDLMLYGTVSTGFRPGIINAALAARIAELEPLRATDPIAEGHYQRLVDRQLVDGDQVINTEVGIKATVMDGALSFTGAAYNVAWKDTIIATQDEINDVAGVTPFAYSYNSNVGDAKSQGMELEIRASLSERLALTVGGDYNWTAKINSSGAGRYLGVEIRPGNRLANAPKYSGYMSLAYDFQLMGIDATARADAYAVAESWNTANNERPAPAYQTLDLKMVLRRDNWSASAYVRNLTDEIIVYEFNQVGFRFGRPRTLGVEFSYSM